MSRLYLAWGGGGGGRPAGAGGRGGGRAGGGGARCLRLFSWGGVGVWPPPTGGAVKPAARHQGGEKHARSAGRALLHNGSDR